MKKILLIVCAFVASGLALDFTSVQSGRWNDNSTWDRGSVPTQTDNVTINHQVTFDVSNSITNVTIEASGNLLCSGAHTLRVYGDWANNGVASLTNGYVFLMGVANTIIGGANPTTFYRLQVTKNGVATTVTMNQNVTCTYGGSDALYITNATLVTNGRNLTVSSTNARVNVYYSGKLDVTVGGTVSIYYLYQNVLSPVQPSRVAVSGSATLNIIFYHQLWNAGSRLDISGGSLNYTGAGTGLSLGSNNPGWGFFAAGGTITFNGGIYSDNGTNFQATQDAVVRFAGSGNPTVQLNWTGTMGTWFFNDLRFEKSSGSSVTFVSTLSVNRSVTAAVGVSVAAGNTVVLGGALHDSVGYRFGSVTNNGMIQQQANKLYVSGSWTGTGAFNPGGKLVTFDGTGDRTVSSAGSFADLTLNKTTGSLTLASDLIVESDLVVTNGSFNVGEHALTLGAAGTSGNADVNAGRFTAVGTAFGRSAVRAADAAFPYTFDVAGPATIGARYADLSGMGSSGINVAGSVDATDCFSYCSFDHGATTGPALKVENSQTLDDILMTDFSGSAGYNVEKFGATGHLTFRGGAGSYWGEDHDNDPNNRVDWLLARDVGVSHLIAPAGLIDSIDMVAPACSVFNYGAGIENYDVRMEVGSYYDKTFRVENHAPGTRVYVEFEGLAEWPRGSHAVTCSTELGGDWDDDNDAKTGTVDVRVLDAGVSSIESPAGEYDSGDEVLPAATWFNRGTEPADLAAWVILEDPTGARVHAERIDVIGLAAGEDTLMDDFAPFEVTAVGRWSVRCSTYLVGDMTNSNDVADGTFLVKPTLAPGWTEVSRSVPAEPSSKAVKDGGWLVTAAPETDAGPFVYAAKGNKTGDFLKYDPAEGDSGAWHVLDSIPSDEGGRAKLPKKGCAGATDGQSYVYATKGNNTLGFWKYDIEGDSWTRLPDVPAGPDGKRVKGGNDLAYAADENDSGWVYLMKGYETEFYRFNTESNRWDTLDDVPYVIAPKYGAGSFLVYDGGGYIYAHQAKYTDAAKTKHFMFRYDLAGQKWDDTLAGMPVLGMDGGKMNSKKSKDGGSGAWYDGSVYALKGGNTCQFFLYDVTGDTWGELDTMPSFGSTAKKKKVKAGGDIASFGNGVFFALKGNKTNEFWRYVIPADSRQPTTDSRSGVQTKSSTIYDLRMTVSPNPIANGYATIRLSGPAVRWSSGQVRIFDAAGRCVMGRSLVCRSSEFAVPLDLRNLANGVYLVRFDADGYTRSQKLVVQK